MKKNIAAIALVLCFGVGIMTGCGKSGVEADASKNEDLSPKVTEENKVDDAETAYLEFTAAKDKMEKGKNFSVISDSVMTMQSEGSTLESHQKTTVKKDASGEKPLAEFEMTSASRAIDQDGTEDEALSTEESRNGYFADDVFYLLMDTSGEKIKYDMTFDVIESMISVSYIYEGIDASQVETAAVNETKDGKEYIFVLDKQMMSDFMLANLAYSGMNVEEGSVDINYANIGAETDKDGLLRSYTLSIDAVIRNGGDEIPMQFNMASVIFDVDSTRVTQRSGDELSEYPTEEEYMEKYMQEMQDLNEIVPDNGAPALDENGEELPQAEEIELTPENAEDYGLELEEGMEGAIKIGE